MRIKKEKPQYDLTKFTLSGKPRKRKPKRDRNYFKEDTDDAIVLYNTLEPGLERDRLFKEKIHDNLLKLAEFLINTFKFDYIVEEIEDLKHELVIFSTDRIHLYDPIKGKAYSYFGTLIKRELITRNKKAYIKKKKIGDFSEVDEEKNTNLTVELTTDEIQAHAFLEAYIEFLEKKKTYYFQKEKESIIVDAIISIFKEREVFKILNKTYIYFMIKEQTGRKSHEISKVIDKVKYLYTKCLKKWYIDGHLDTQEITFSDIYL